jgi:UDP-N-acetyl-D-glucosamine dehydrogenase
MNVTVVGQGYVGLPIAVKAAEAGLFVCGFDIDIEKIQRLKNGNTDSPDISRDQIIKLQAGGHLKFISRLDEAIGTKIFVIAVPTPVNSSLEPDHSYLEKACLSISKFVSPKTLIVNESTSHIGTLRDFIKPIIDSNSGQKDLMYAVAPERIDPGNLTWNVKNTPRVIAGLDVESSKHAFEFYSKFCDQITIVSKPEIAEAAKLLENTYRHINIALINELSGIFKSFNISTTEVVNAASTKPFGFTPFFPGIGVGGHCIPVDPNYLLFSAKNVGVDSKFIKLANEINQNMSKVIIERIEKFLGGTVENKKIQLVGISYKSNISDTRESPAIVLMKNLRELGSTVSWFDPLVREFEGESSSELDSDIDVGLILAPHNEIDLTIWERKSIKVLDLSPTFKNYGWTKFL